MEKIELQELLSKLLATWQRHNAVEYSDSPGQRLIVAIAGAPASGKSTLAQWLCRELNLRLSPNPSVPVDIAVVIPMDGYHFDNAIIDAVGLLQRKGSPETFDVSGFSNTLQRIRQLPYKSATEKTPSDLASGIAVPVFDRKLDLARAGAEMIKLQHGIVLVEGNYLLLNEMPWSQLKPLFDLSIFLQVPMNVLEQRLIARWLAHDHSEEEARDRAAGNDLPNARRVLENSEQADLQLTNWQISAETVD